MNNETIKTRLKHRLLSMAAILFGCCVVFVIVYLPTDSWLMWAWIVWNLFLALVPLVFSSLIIYFCKQKSRQKILITVLALAWLLFLPNAFYYLTDLMWITRVTETNPGFRPEDITSIATWASLMSIAVAEFIAILAGLISLYDVHKIIISEISKWRTRLIIATVIVLNGFAIYMGRFLRLNSWDVILPWRLAIKVFANIDLFALKFTLLMSITIAILYGVFLLIKRKTTPVDD